MQAMNHSLPLAALLSLSAVANAHSPIHTAMNIPTNPQAPVKASQHIFIQATPQQVWAVLTNIDAWAAWQTDIRQPKLHGPLRPGTTFDWKTGGAGIHSTLHTVEPDKQFGWTGRTFGMYAVHNWTLTPMSGGTQVAVDETMQGLLAGLFKKSFNANLATGMQQWLERLKAEAEK
jgi:uncharacterized protein YndB with AHSA1/START domain